jgi:3-deoxy-7-phosphoheptulonate synthase
VTEGNRSIRALMIESNLAAGNQGIPGNLADLKYGVSITDKCVDWNTTERMLRHAHSELAKNHGRPL